MEFVCYPKCSTCQKAKRFWTPMGLRIRCVISIQPAFGKGAVRLVESQWASASQVFNTSGLAYRALSLKEKLPEMSEEKQLKLWPAMACW